VTACGKSSDWLRWCCIVSVGAKQPTKPTIGCAGRLHKRPPLRIK
jgi:hypothetical protein